MAIRVKILREFTTHTPLPGEPGTRQLEAGEIIENPPPWLWKLAKTGYGRDANGNPAPFAKVVETVLDEIIDDPNLEGPPDWSDDDDAVEVVEADDGPPLPEAVMAKVNDYASEFHGGDIAAALAAFDQMQWRELVSLFGPKAAKQVRDFLKEHAQE